MSAEFRARKSRPASFVATVLLIVAVPAAARERPAADGEPLPDYALRIVLADGGGPADGLQLAANGLPHILLTGYWPRTNEMIRRFSRNAQQNPAGWAGEHWESRGYNIYSFFPEFPNGLGRGVGDFEVDYQDTSRDWWPLVGVMKPLAIVTFSRSGPDFDWELEGGHRTYAPGRWVYDYLFPYQPTPGLPIVDLERPLTERYSSLPIQAIIDAVLADPQLDGLLPYATTMDESHFLSNFIGYHGCWYHELHADPVDGAWNVAAGHIHVGSRMSLADAVQATHVTLRALTKYLDSVVLVPAGDMNCDNTVNALDVDPFVLALTDPASYTARYPFCFINRADLNGDAVTNAADVEPFVQLLLGG